MEQIWEQAKEYEVLKAEQVDPRGQQLTRSGKHLFSG